MEAIGHAYIVIRKADRDRACMLSADRLSVKEKIRLATLTRLAMNAPYLDRWPEALAIMGQPSNMSMSLNHLAKIVDEIWHLAGDKSADVSLTLAVFISEKDLHNLIPTF